MTEDQATRQHAPAAGEPGHAGAREHAGAPEHAARAVHTGAHEHAGSAAHAPAAERATVDAVVATLWSAPEAVRDGIDSAAAQGDPQRWVSGLGDRDRYYAGVLTQLWQGEPVLVEEVRDGWAKVVATAQPADRLDPRGYPGWMLVDQLRFDDVVAIARRWVGATYVWGGLTEHGIDCSGLVHLAHRSAGRRVPRDAQDQFSAAVPVDEPRIGDLYFFAGDPARPGHITHVGFVTGPDRMLHACGDKGYVVEEPMPDERRATLVGVRRLL